MKALVSAAILATVLVGCSHDGLPPPATGYTWAECPLDAPADTVCPTFRFFVSTEWSPAERDVVAAGLLVWREHGHDVRLVDAWSPGVFRVMPGEVAPGLDGQAFGGTQRQIVIARDIHPVRLRTVATHEAGHLVFRNFGHHDGIGIMSPTGAVTYVTDDDIAWGCEVSGHCPLGQD